MSVIQDTDVEALQPHSLQLGGTIELKPPPPAGTGCVAGDSVYAQEDWPAWLTVSVAEPPVHCTVRVPLRLAVVGFGWTNAAFVELLHSLPPEKVAPLAESTPPGPAGH